MGQALANRNVQMVHAREDDAGAAAAIGDDHEAVSRESAGEHDGAGTGCGDAGTGCGAVADSGGRTGQGAVAISLDDMARDRRAAGAGGQIGRGAAGGDEAFDRGSEAGEVVLRSEAGGGFLRGGIGIRHFRGFRGINRGRKALLGGLLSSGGGGEFLPGGLGLGQQSGGAGGLGLDLARLRRDTGGDGLHDGDATHGIGWGLRGGEQGGGGFGGETLHGGQEFFQSRLRALQFLRGTDLGRLQLGQMLGIGAGLILEPAERGGGLHLLLGQERGTGRVRPFMQTGGFFGGAVLRQGAGGIGLRIGPGDGWE